MTETYQMRIYVHCNKGVPYTSARLLFKQKILQMDNIYLIVTIHLFLFSENHCEKDFISGYWLLVLKNQMIEAY